VDDEQFTELIDVLRGIRSTLESIEARIALIDTSD
jgi:hypothetical protein